ncbi:quinone oxidoreductase [Staphylotrichum tortipilum]|uniref:Quinone oxidoreductase n=1 Tax=Staphylotrichum tortipilum TaxID=2831512 RepID=A0AAN6RV51_9PEZI|nr:quinone oxidoreductase [Staphylotrichum longicolle]
MASVMRAVDIKNGRGDATALFINPTTPIPHPGPGQALVKVSAFGLNRMDLIQREGRYNLPPQAPSTLGVEFSGVITALGPALSPPAASTSEFAVGDAVFGLAYGGAYAEYLCVSLQTLMRKPPHLSFEQAAAVPETWMTATQALHFVLGGINDPAGKQGKSILWHAGASGVSIAGIQLSRQAGAGAVYATAGSQAKCEFVEGTLGADAAVDYKTRDWVADILEKTGGQGVDLVVDFVGGDYFQKNLDVVGKDGRICMLGLMGGAVAENVNLAKLLYKRARVEGSTLRSRDEEYQGRLRDKLAEYLPMFESGELKIFIDTVLPWERIVEAHQLLEENKTMGKIVCTIS